MLGFVSRRYAISGEVESVEIKEKKRKIIYHLLFSVLT
jgi:hypothetical protein